MATRTTTQMIDDLDGTISDDVATVRFSVDGALYEMELSPENRAKLDAAVRPFAERARIGLHTPSGAPKNKRYKRQGTPAWKIREWAGENDIAVADRGRISQEIVAQYEEANGGA
jgi:phosphoglycolate phosphatase-like HAD superfamily hydrolase